MPPPENSAGRSTAHNTRRLRADNGYLPCLSSPVDPLLLFDDANAVFVKRVNTPTQPAGEEPIPDGRFQAQLPAIEFERLVRFNQEVTRRRLRDAILRIVPRCINHACEFHQRRHENARALALYATLPTQESAFFLPYSIDLSDLPC